MSYRQISNAEERLHDVLSRFVPTEHIGDTVDAIKALAEAMADDAVDRVQQRGDYDPDQ